MLPGVLWPDYWSFNGTDRTVENGRCPGHYLQSSRQLLRPDDISASLMHHTAVLLTFGIMCPVVAIAIASTICLHSVQWVLLTNRFVFKRLLLGGMWEMNKLGNEQSVSLKPGLGREQDNKASSSDDRDSDGCSINRGKIVQDVIAIIMVDRTDKNQRTAVKLTKKSTQQYERHDASIRLLETSVESIDTLLAMCVVPVITISCIFFIFFSWDITADRLGFIESLWVPAIVAVIPFLHLFILTMRNRTIGDSAHNERQLQVNEL